MTRDANTTEVNTSTSSHRLFWLLASSGIVLLIALMVAAGAGHANQSVTSPLLQTVQVTPVERASGYWRESQSVGVVEAQNNTDISVELSGQIAFFAVDEGDSVNQGQVIAQLDTQRLEAQRAELGARLDSARAQATLAKLTVNRITQLVERGLESSQRLDEENAQWQAAKAQVNAILASINSVNVDIKKCQIRAPFSGQITQRYIDTGSVINAGQPLVGLTANTALEARFALPDKLAKGLRVGDELEIHQGKQTLVGTVISSQPQRATQTRTIDIKVALSGDTTLLLPGDMVTTTLTQRDNTPGFWVPTSALSNGLRGLWTLYVVSREGEHTLSSRSVEVLYIREEQAFVRGAVDEQEYVVTSGTQRLVPNQIVKAVLLSPDSTAG